MHFVWLDTKALHQGTHEILGIRDRHIEGILSAWPKKCRTKKVPLSSLMHVTFTRVIAINYWRIHSIVHRLLKNSISTLSKIIKNKTNYSYIVFFRGSNIFITLAIMFFLLFFSPIFKGRYYSLPCYNYKWKKGRGIEPQLPKLEFLGSQLWTIS